MPRLGVIFVQYYPERYKNAFSTLVEIVRLLEEWKVVIVKVDNKYEQQEAKLIDPSLIETGGDNSLYEFSGWMKGWETLKQYQGQCDCYLFVTEAFLVYGDEYRDLVNSNLLQFLITESAVAGLVDPPPADFKNLRLLDWQLTHWVRSSFYFVPHPVILQMKTLVSIPDTAPFCDQHYEGRAFKLDSPLSHDYQVYLEQWLTRDWHSAFTLSDTTWERFYSKIRSILNEHALTGRWQAMAVPVYDLHFLKALGNKTKSTLSELPPEKMEPYRHDLQLQKDYCAPSLAVRVVKKIGNLIGGRI
ncbi:MAG: hypothetical protein HQM14_04970 [SAR324 cluster bacterium]|nr:hypothetical protein [SAR324 cluster bacterium]